ncbi:MAG: IspD/TarI family cytidylyltransferase [Odoribacter sp.]
MEKNIGIILAGGSGQRVGGDIPKQFLLIAGKTILEHTLSVFQECGCIDEIFIITHSHYLKQTEEMIQGSHFSKVTQILPGGNERYHSTLAALKACPESECNLIIHDAVRPLLTSQMIYDCVEALQKFTACTTAIPSTDTLLVCDDTHCYIKDIPNRNFLYNIQTPQAFRKSILIQAYQLASLYPDFCATDDCGVIKKYLPEIRIKIIKGSPSNFKITYPNDLITARKLLSKLDEQPH